MAISERETDASAPLGQGRGFALGVGCYALWGLLPLYWALLAHVSSLEILAHRLLWAFVFLAAVCLAVRRRETLALFRQRRALLILGTAGLLITFNWGLYIYAVTNGHILQASLGYYINPLFNILLGVAFFKERLSWAQRIATGLAAAGVLYFTFDYGSFPLIAICLATTFAVYGLLKKFGGYSAVPAMAVETTVAVPLAIAFVALSFLVPTLTGGARAFLTFDATGALGATTIFDSLLLIVGGALTALPLILFASAANTISYSMLGFIQYLSPTLTLLLGVFVFHEPFTHAHAVCFALIWAGLLLVAIEAVVLARRRSTS